MMPDQFGWDNHFGTSRRCTDPVRGFCIDPDGCAVLGCIQRHEKHGMPGCVCYGANTPELKDNCPCQGTSR